MKKNKVKYPDAIIQDLSSIFALKDSNATGYLSGPKLIAMFNSLGFADSYKFPDIGIVTPDENGLSRRKYAYKRLSDLNDQFRLPEAITAFKSVTDNLTQIAEVFNRYKMELPFQMLPAQHTVLIQEGEESNILSTSTPTVESSDESQDDKKLTQKEIDSVFEALGQFT